MIDADELTQELEKLEEEDLDLESIAYARSNYITGSIHNGRRTAYRHVQELVKDRKEHTMPQDRNRDDNDANEDVLVGTTRDQADRGSRDQDDYDSNTRDSVDVGANITAWNTNNKRTYDVYQELELEQARQHMAHLSRLNMMAEQSLQNAVSLSNRVSNDAAGFSAQVNTQSLNNQSVAASEIWSRLESSDLAESVEEGELIQKGILDDVALKAIGAAVADAVTAALSGVIVAANQPTTVTTKSPV